MYNSSNMKKFTKSQIENRIEKNKAVKALELDDYQVANLTSFIHAISQGRAIFLTEHDDKDSEWNLYYINEEYKPCIFWVIPLMNKSKNKHGRAFCFRSNICGMDKILNSTDFLMNTIEEITGCYVQLTRSDLL